MRTTEVLDVVICNTPGIVHLVTIPPGYAFDGASIPRLVWSIIGHPFDPTFTLAACVHDWYCEAATKRNDYQIRVIGDAVFFALLARAGVAKWKRTMLYAAVRMYSFLYRSQIGNA